MVMAVTISCPLRKIVSARSTVTEVSIAGAGLVDAGDALGQPRIERVGPDDVAVGFLVHAAIIAEILSPPETAHLRWAVMAYLSMCGAQK